MLRYFLDSSFRRITVSLHKNASNIYTTAYTDSIVHIRACTKTKILHFSINMYVRYARKYLTHAEARFRKQMCCRCYFFGICKQFFFYKNTTMEVQMWLKEENSRQRWRQEMRSTTAAPQTTTEPLPLSNNEIIQMIGKTLNVWPEPKIRSESSIFDGC